MLCPSLLLRTTILCALLLGALMFSPTGASAASTIYVPLPTGVDDTINIQGALDNCMTNYPTGCTIQLSAGAYKCTQLIAEDFHGTFKGAGMGATTIEVLAPLIVTVSEQLVFDIAPSRSNKYPMLLIFTGGDITVSDMTFKVTDPNPTTPWCYSIGCGQTWLEGLVGVVGQSANLTVERVGFEGAPGSLDGYNFNNGPFFLGLSGTQLLSGTFKLLSSRISHAENGVEAFSLHEAKVLIGGAPETGNFFEQSMLGGVIGDWDNSNGEYSYNTVSVGGTGSAGLMILQGGIAIPDNSSQFLIQHNSFRTAGRNADGILVLDAGPLYGMGKRIDLGLFDNKIEMSGSGPNAGFAGIELVFTEDSVIANNRISGENVIAGIVAESALRCMLKANNLEQLHASFMPIALLGLDSGFPWDTSACTVVGGNTNANVYDEGTSNVLTGARAQGNPLGPAIKAAMEQRRELLKVRFH